MITVSMITPTGAYKTFEAKSVTLDTTDGQRGILSNHMPIVLMLKIGTIKCVTEDKTQLYTTSGGMMYFENNTMTILSNAIESYDSIDVERAQKAYERAQQRINAKNDNVDVQRAQLALARALNRINAVSNYRN